ncbi:MAG TPA: hypothetical protein VEV83_21730 [Parafilimonas sp.]|nr:hypothetical protein [Parafilimonas sp.]
MKTIFLKPSVLMVATATLFSSCASIMSKTAYDVSINTTPDSANIVVTDKKGKQVYEGQSPAEVSLKSGAGFFAKAEYQVKLSAPGYAEKTIPITYQLNGWYLGNIIFGGAIGLLIVDPATGAMWKIADPKINATLTKTTNTSGMTTPTLNVVDIKDVSQELKSQLVRIN